MVHIFWLFLLFFSVCNAYNPSKDRILCIVNYNWPYYENITLLKKFYAKLFPNMIFYGPKKNTEDLHYIDHHQGYFGYKDIVAAMVKYPDYDGYFFTNDDCMLNIDNFARLDCNKIWFIPPNISPFSEALKNHYWYWWKTEWGFSALRNTFAEFSPAIIERMESSIGKGNAAWIWADVVYIPQRYKDEFIALATIFLKHNVFLEIATPNICVCLDNPKNWEILNALYLWGEDRTKLFQKYKPSYDFIHPVKLSDQKNVDFILSKLAN